MSGLRRAWLHLILRELSSLSEHSHAIVAPADEGRIKVTKCVLSRLKNGFT